jgi:membrane-associated PAP2 superfamily phosphatase
LTGLVALALLATLPFLLTNLDLRLQNLFYRPDADPAWFAESWKLWRLLYTVGTWPALALGLGTLGFLLWSPRRPSLTRWRRHALLVILTLALGPGLLVNVVFKDHWGRPRPRQTTQFGGRWEYQPLLEKGLSGRGKSFPCGHSSMGYVFIVFYFLLRRRRLLALAAAAAAITLGTLIGLARMAAGAHFASDVLWSALIPAAIAFLLYYFVLRIPQHEDAPGQTVARSRPLWLLLGVPIVGLALLASGLAATPAYTDINYAVNTPGNSTGVEVVSDGCDMELVFDPETLNQVKIGGHAQGFGWPWSNLRHQAEMMESNGLRRVQFSFRREGHFTEVSGQITLRVPVTTSGRVNIRLKNGDLELKAPAGAALPPLEFTIDQGRVLAPPLWESKLSAETTPAGTTTYRLSPAP